MPDFDAIAVAIAARYAAAAITANGGPPAGLPNVRKATADLPQLLTAMPAVLIFPEAGELEPGSGTRTGTHTFLARFYFGLTRNLARETNACRKWLTILVGQHGTALALGGLVVAVRTRGWRIGVLPHGGKNYTGIELRLEVVTSEPWTPT